MDTITPQDAQAQLAEARLRTQGISGFTPAWVGYELILAAMAFAALGVYCDEHPDFFAFRTPFLITGFAWLACGIAFVTFAGIVSKTALRGFGRRWEIMMGVWTACYAALICVTTFTSVTLPQLLALLSALPLLGIAGPAWEMLALRKSRRAIS